YESEFNGEPEGTRDSPDHALDAPARLGPVGEMRADFRCGVRAHSEPLQRGGEFRKCVQRQMPADVVENIWLGQVVGGFGRTHRNGCRKFPATERIEKSKRRKETAHRESMIAGALGEARIYFFQSRDCVRMKAQLLAALKEGRRAVFLPQ